MSDQYQLNYWGVFKNKEIESSYIGVISRDALVQNRFAILLSGIGYSSLLFADLLKLGLIRNFYICLFMRLLYLAICVTGYFLTREKTNYKFSKWFTIFITYCNSALILSLVYFGNPSLEITPVDQITVPVVTLLFYIFAYIPLIYLFVNGILVTLAYLLLLTFAMKTQSHIVLNVTIILLCINFLGLFVIRFFNMTRRKEYIQNNTIHDLNQNLMSEMHRRSAMQKKLEVAFREITDSITYASRIQQAMLPSQTILAQNVSEHFVLWKPRDIVSGDFYFCTQLDGNLIVAVADCTGHGVPGAFMSMLGIAFLNEIITHRGISQPNLILNTLRKEIKQALGQTGKIYGNKEGMDIALFSLDLRSYQLQYAGAYQPLWILRRDHVENELKWIENKADRMPIGVHPRDDQSFTNHDLQLQNDDTVYIFSDGYSSQFGGEKDQKLKSSRFKELLKKHSGLPLKKQKLELDNELIRWRGKHKQVDDVLVLGLKIKIQASVPLS